MGNPLQKEKRTKEMETQLLEMFYIFQMLKELLFILYFLRRWQKNEYNIYLYFRKKKIKISTIDRNTFLFRVTKLQLLPDRFYFEVSGEYTCTRIYVVLGK